MAAVPGRSTRSLACTMTPLSEDPSRLIGIWKLISYEVELQGTGGRVYPWGKNPIGYLILTAEGRMMAVLERDGRTPPKTDEERAAAFQSMLAYTGIYRVEGDKWITKVDASWNPVLRDADQVRFFKLEADRLSVVSMWRPHPFVGEKMGRGILSWERAK